MFRTWPAVLLLLLAACGADSGGDPDDTPPSDRILTLTKVDSWRTGLAESLDTPFGVLEVAFDRPTAEQAWRENTPADLPDGTLPASEAGRYGDLDEVDFDTHAVVVWSSGQSGSCPSWVGSVHVDEDGALFITTTHAPADACTDDYNPYSQMLAVPRDRLPDQMQLPTSARIIDNVEIGPRALVRAYPTGD